MATTAICISSADTMTSISMMGFAASPGTEVDPTCSTRAEVTPDRAWRRSPATSSNWARHEGEYGTTSTGTG